MTAVSSKVTKKALGMLRAETGLAFAAAETAAREGVELTPVEAWQVRAQNASAEIVEKSVGGKYPSFQVYCEKVENLLTEKFRTFAGRCRMAVEVRVSQDRLEGIEESLGLYVDAVTQVLDTHRGDWGEGVYYAGGYEASFGGVKHGGKNFLQAGKVSFAVEVSVS